MTQRHAAAATRFTIRATSRSDSRAGRVVELVQPIRERTDWARRQVVEHRIVRLVQPRIRQARYVGRTKTLFQLLMAAAVTNLTLLANTATAEGDGAIVAGIGFALAVVFLACRSRPDGPEGPTPDLRWLVPRSASPAL